MNRSQHLLMVAAALLGLVTCGCGGGGSTAPVASNPSPAPAPPPPQMLPQAAPQVRPAVVPAKSGRSRLSKAKVKEPSVPTSQDFIIDVEHDPFVLERPRGTSLRDQFIAFSPAAGAIPNEFEIVPPDRAGERQSATETTQQATGVELPEGFAAISTTLTGPGQMPARIRCALDGSEMVYVPAGVFMQGTDAGPADCGPAHPAFVSGFYIDVTEVTLGQFAKFQQLQRERKRGTLNDPVNAGSPPDHPALGLTWRDAELYARQIGKELPTEAEWEKAARGSSSYVYPWGNGRVAWNAHRVPGQIDGAKTFPADQSVYGVFDMAGNAREWCSDWYASNYYPEAKERDGSAIRDPKGPSRAEIVGHHVVKGGQDGWELWQRNHAVMRESIPDVGFRCVLHVRPGSASKSAPKVEAEPPSRPKPAGTSTGGF